VSAELDYLGVKPCGCAVAWQSAENKRPHIAKEIAHWIMLGYDVQRVTTDEARVRLKMCVHVPRPMKQEELAL
jgi:hypothetical protein